MSATADGRCSSQPLAVRLSGDVPSSVPRPGPLHDKAPRRCLRGGAVPEPGAAGDDLGGHPVKRGAPEATSSRSWTTASLLSSGLYRRPRSSTGSCVTLRHARGLYRRSGIEACASHPAPKGLARSLYGMRQRKYAAAAALASSCNGRELYPPWSRSEAYRAVDAATPTPRSRYHRSSPRHTAPAPRRVARRNR
jgi:hypothetical protein